MRKDYIYINLIKKSYLVVCTSALTICPTSTPTRWDRPSSSSRTRRFLPQWEVAAGSSDCRLLSWEVLSSTSWEIASSQWLHHRCRPPGWWDRWCWSRHWSVSDSWQVSSRPDCCVCQHRHCTRTPSPEWRMRTQWKNREPRLRPPQSCPYRTASLASWDRSSPRFWQSSRQRQRWKWSDGNDSSWLCTLPADGLCKFTGIDPNMPMSICGFCLLQCRPKTRTHRTCWSRNTIRMPTQWTRFPPISLPPVSVWKSTLAPVCSSSDSSSSPCRLMRSSRSWTSWWCRDSISLATLDQCVSEFAPSTRRWVCCACSSHRTPRLFHRTILPPREKATLGANPNTSHLWADSRTCILGKWHSWSTTPESGLPFVLRSRSCPAKWQTGLCIWDSSWSMSHASSSSRNAISKLATTLPPFPSAPRLPPNNTCNRDICYPPRSVWSSSPWSSCTAKTMASICPTRLVSSGHSSPRVCPYPCHWPSHPRTTSWTRRCRCPKCPTGWFLLWCSQWKERLWLRLFPWLQDILFALLCHCSWTYSSSTALLLHYGIDVPSTFLPDPGSSRSAWARYSLNIIFLAYSICYCVLNSADVVWM